MKSSTLPFFERFAVKVTKATGRPVAFLMACLVILIWIFTGPVFKFSDTWQLVINTGTTIITFLMVFVIQHAQNKDSVALQLKLNELIAASSRASNRLVDVEDLSAEELETLKKFYIKLSELAKLEKNIHRTHSIDEAENTHQDKIRTQDESKR
ncbi:MAG TPA: low affinity iron permease family protein [Chitinophagaceae bacterium]|nr:low affinity iron permease family protein [Chitinophagaceae bacterium]HPH30685.1 low affinity iron permease family protein [Chitinophagaceae bacterium]HPN58161.1 low affinity iron permease family protein [Chitinophagaceae bacterium]